MFGIVVFHIIIHSTVNLNNASPDDGKQYLYLLFFTLLGHLGNHIFFLLAGYFLANKAFKFERIKKLAKQTWFYSVSISLVVLAVAVFGITAQYGYNLHLTFAELAKAFLPIVTGRYWFITTYIIVILISPCLNMLLKKLSKEQFKTGLIVAIGVFYLLTMLGLNYEPNINFNMIGHLLQYGLTYVLGVYFALHPPQLKRRALYPMFLVYAVIVFWALYSNIYLPDGMVISNIRTDWLPFAGAVLMFLLFRSFKMPNIRIINSIAACVFPIYLIHEHPYVWVILNKHILDLQSLMGTRWVYLFPWLSGILVFTACLLIELTRKKIVSIYDKKRLKNLE